jgi:hypothetical protein
MSLINPNCDGGKCRKNGEVRLLPINKKYDGNLILCYDCFLVEIAWRKSRNLDLCKEAQYSLPNWNELQVYSGNE